MTDKYQALAAPFPKEAMTKDTSRGFALTSIKAQYVRERLNEVMGVDGWETQSQVVNIDNDGNVAVKIDMTLHFGDRSVTRCAFGGAKKKAKGQTYGDVFKSAETDAICKVASNFGVGNDVFKGLVNPETLETSGGKTAPTSSPAPKKTSSGTKKPSFRDRKKNIPEPETTVVSDGDGI